MFNNIKNLLNEIVEVIKDTNFKKLYSNTIHNTKEGIGTLKYKISNLFETNITNGLTHYYSGHYSDALTRFKIMNKMWPNNPVVHYNLGRCYFILEKFDKAKTNLTKALDLNPDDEHKQLIEYYIAKIAQPSKITFIPEALKKEFYEYSIHSEIHHYSIHEEHLKKLFDLYNRYISAIVVNKEEENTSILDIGCHIGMFGKFYRQSYKHAYIEGIDMSNNMIELCDDLNIDFDSNTHKVYDKVVLDDMHHFLIENYKDANSTQNNNENKECRFYDVITSIGTFAEFGELSAILKLCESNLNLNGILIFVVPKSKVETIQFSTNTDCYYYTEEYIKTSIKENTDLEIVDIINKNVVKEDNEQMIVIAKRKIHSI